MSKQLVVTDRPVANYRSMIDQLGAPYCDLLLDSESDGVAQITGYVNEQPGFDVLRLSSHGSPLGVAVSPTSYSLTTARPLEGFGARPTMTPAESLKEAAATRHRFGGQLNTGYDRLKERGIA
jgi:hypothetical protein